MPVESGIPRENRIKINPLHSNMIRKQYKNAIYFKNLLSIFIILPPCIIVI